MKPRFTVFLDTMVWLATMNRDNSDHGKAMAIMKRIGRHKNRTIFISDYVFDEMFGVITRNQKHGNLTRDQRKAAVDKVMQNIYNSTTVSIEKVSEFVFGTAMQYVEHHPEIPASLTDWTIFLIAVEKKIPIIATFDPDFKKITKLPEFSDIKIWDK